MPPSPSRPNSEPTFTFGWRSTSRVIYQVEPFTEPRHAGVLTELQRLRAPTVETGGHQRWRVEIVPGKTGMKVTALDPEVGLSKPFLAKIHELGKTGFRTMMLVIDQLALVVGDAPTREALSLMASQMVADVTRHARVPRPNGWVEQGCVQFRFDRGTSIFLPAGSLPFTGEETEREEQGDRLVRFRRRVAPALPSLTATRDEHAACVEIVIPGVPRTHPLAGWTEIENSARFMLERSIMISPVA